MKKLLSIFITLCLCLTLFPTMAFAAIVYIQQDSVTFQIGKYKESGQAAHNDVGRFSSEGGGLVGDLPDGIAWRDIGGSGMEFYGTALPGSFHKTPYTVTPYMYETNGSPIQIIVTKGPQIICVDAAINDAITIPLGATYTLDTYSKDASGSKIDIATDYPSLTATDHQPTYTYTSSNTAVATVDPTTGVVTPVAKGTTTITINSAATSSYEAANDKTITLTVEKNSRP